MAPSWLPPVPTLDELSAALQAGYMTKYLAIILPMGLFNLIGSLQNIESAEAAGDSYPTAPSLAVNGLGSVAACAFGSPFPTTIYIGHPGWKAMGARAGYSVLNAVFFTVVCLAGVLGSIQYVIPIDAGMAIVLYIGIVITAQAFQATPREHAPAAVIGMLPSLAAWGTFMASQAFGAAGAGGRRMEEFLPAFTRNTGYYLEGGFAVNEGFVLTSMILAAIAVAVIERQFRRGATWALFAAAFSACGLMHSFQWTDGGPTMALGTAALRWTFGYLAVAGLLCVAPWITEDAGEKVH
jgi:AGZA family xanthine/uracil permease-like MFS transporter